MKTNYQNINSFEVAVVGMITIGFVLIGAILFTSLTPRAQRNVGQAVSLFDLHQEIDNTASVGRETVGYVLDVPNQFYNQFYIAFEQVVTFPGETFETPVAVASQIVQNISVAVNNLADQASAGYAEANNIAVEQAGIVDHSTQVAFTGKVLGAAIDVSDTIAKADLLTKPEDQPNYNFSYRYAAPDLGKLKLSFTKLTNH